MNTGYGRDLDLNLLRVFAVVADTGSVTAAASRLYLTQPAVSAALRRLTATIGAPLFVRRGRGLELTGRGKRLHAALVPHLRAIVDAALSEPQWSPAASDRTLRLGLSDVAELWLLPALLRVLAREAPRMSVVAVPVQFRTVASALAGGLDAAVTVADELPATVRRQPLFCGGFVCLFDPRRTRLRRTLTADEYFALDHVIVSYNGDLRGIVEDVVQRSRTVRCSVSTFASLGALLDGSGLVATVPSSSPRTSARPGGTSPRARCRSSSRARRQSSCGRRAPTTTRRAGSCATRSSTSRDLPSASWLRPVDPRAVVSWRAARPGATRRCPGGTSRSCCGTGSC
ncbi:LysR family transcriptional regulator [Sorangium sp. So ce145]|uniref:LysR family transcriptional regulator n=1 Tax=Sorangium sp. So ce145 TaxID=3133285 RepID=UPI003F62D3EB